MFRCVWISKDGIAMWPAGAAIIPENVWHRTAMKPTTGFFDVELFDREYYYEVYRVMPHGSIASTARFQARMKKLQQKNIP